MPGITWDDNTVTWDDYRTTWDGFQAIAYINVSPNDVREGVLTGPINSPVPGNVILPPSAKVAEGIAYDTNGTVIGQLEVQNLNYVGENRDIHLTVGEGHLQKILTRVDLTTANVYVIIWDIDTLTITLDDQSPTKDQEGVAFTVTAAVTNILQRFKYAIRASGTNKLIQQGRVINNFAQQVGIP